MIFLYTSCLSVSWYFTPHHRLFLTFSFSPSDTLPFCLTLSSLTFSLTISVVMYFFSFLFLRTLFSPYFILSNIFQSMLHLLLRWHLDFVEADAGLCLAQGVVGDTLVLPRVALLKVLDHKLHRDSVNVHILLKSVFLPVWLKTDIFRFVFFDVNEVVHFVELCM